MRIEEITTDYEISVNVAQGDGRANFTTTPAFVEGDALYVRPFMHDKYILSFSAEGLKIDMAAYKEDGPPVYWRAVWITTEERKGRTYHVIRSKLEGARINRRSAIRLTVGTVGTVAIRPVGKPCDVEIHDISATGVCFTKRGDGVPGVKKESRVRLTFTDPDTGFSGDFLCRVVRVSRRNERMFYGCAFTRVYLEVGRFIANKRIRGKT